MPMFEMPNAHARPSDSSTMSSWCSRAQTSEFDWSRHPGKALVAPYFATTSCVLMPTSLQIQGTVGFSQPFLIDYTSLKTLPPSAKCR